MGNCISFAPEGKPKCEKCGKEGPQQWHEMSSILKAQWVWDSEICVCQTCLSHERIERLKYEKEREYYARAKKQLYPKLETKTTLKRIKSDEKWEGTSSFYQTWRPPSALAHLMEALTPQSRKGTGFIGDAGNSGANKEVDAATAAAMSSSGTEQLERLEEEMEMVEEESLDSSRSNSIENAAR